MVNKDLPGLSEDLLELAQSENPCENLILASSV